MIRRSPPRAGYTLLEIILAASLAVLLLGGLYIAMRVQVRGAQEARESVEQGTLVRSLVARIASDIAGNLGAAPRTSSGSSGGSSRGSAGSNGSSTTGSTSPSTSTAGSTASGSSSTGTTTSSFNLGVYGDATRVVLYISRPVRPDSLLQAVTMDSELPPGTCDLRRITYWLVTGNGDASGLARQEVKQVTAEDAMSTIPPDVQNEASFVIAPEVKNLVFSYFDGTQWLGDWDGTTPGPDGTTPKGPPLAIAFEMSITVPGSTTERMIRHVVALQSANGTAQATSSGSTSGSSGTGR